MVRLKGGDPFVFGRGGEEALACVRAGVAFEVVPGVSAASRRPPLAGIPVTHRGIARSFAVVTGTPRTATASIWGARDRDGHAGRVDGGREARGDVRAADRAAGRPDDEPAAIVQWAATPEQRTVGTLGAPPALAAAARIGPPATLVVGTVAALAAATAPAPAPVAAVTRP